MKPGGWHIGMIDYVHTNRKSPRQVQNAYVSHIHKYTHTHTLTHTISAADMTVIYTFMTNDWTL